MDTRFKRGEPSAFKGRKHTPISRKKMSESLKGKNLGNQHAAGKPSWNKGKPMSDESKKKVSISRSGIPAWNKGKKCPQFSGDKNPRWKGGVSTLVEMIRHSLEYRQWRSDVFTIDKYTCQFCGQQHGDIEVDHFPKTFAQIFDENKITSLEQAIKCNEFWNINNGRTLCRECHKIRHGKK